MKNYSLKIVAKMKAQLNIVEIKKENHILKILLKLIQNHPLNQMMI